MRRCAARAGKIGVIAHNPQAIDDCPLMTLTDLRTHVLNVSPKTNWVFVTAHDRDGNVGLGEASLNGMEPIVREAVRMQAQALIGMDVSTARDAIEVLPRGPGGLAWSAATSAIEQAITDLIARARELPLNCVLGELRREQIPVYANINRATADRSPLGCADSARAAVQQGFRAVKIAPFDNVMPRTCGSDAGRSAVALGVQRVQAICEAVGKNVSVMVDCHWRFDAATATRVLIELAELGVTWFECPVSEQPGWWPVLKRLRRLANDRGVRVAGAETQVGVASFRPLLDEGLFDVVMPDVKYVGGYREMLRVAQLARQCNTAFSPHNPSGPVCNFASLHVAAVAPAVDQLEYQLGESVLFFDVVHGQGPRLTDGAFTVPMEPGLGLTLDMDVMAAHPYAPVPIAPDPRLG